MNGLALVVLGLTLTAAVFVVLVTYRQMPSIDSIIDEVLGPADEGDLVDQLLPVVRNDGDDFDDSLADAYDRTPVLAVWCEPCYAFRHFHEGRDVISHLVSHIQDPHGDDFAAWQEEMSR